jgi:hypothetical protein
LNRFSKSIQKGVEMYTPLAAHVIRRETARAARAETPVRPQRRQPMVVRRRLATALRWSADRLAPECR